MKDVLNSYPYDAAFSDYGPEQGGAGPGLGFWLVPMMVGGGAAWITALVYLLR